ncbi:hypothetical protein DITRI_Ditri03aG0060900 [Diplodiscus trichospermus]
MESRHLREQIAAMRRSLIFVEGILDLQFTELEKLQDRENPNFVEKLLTLYLRESTRQLNTVEKSMETVPIDFRKVDINFNCIAGSSASIGARKVLMETHKTWKLWQERNLEGAKAAFQELRKEHDTFKAKLQPYIQVFLSTHVTCTPEFIYFSCFLYTTHCFPQYGRN